MLHIDYADLFSSFPPELATLLIAMLPIAELRAALPIALTVFKMSVWSAFFWSIIGNLLPVALLLYILGPLSCWLEQHSRVGNRFFSWLARRTQKRFEKSKTRHGSLIALIFFVAIPLPITGAWTGALAAYLFGIPVKRAFAAISVGVLIASVIVYLITKGIISFS